MKSRHLLHAFCLALALLASLLARAEAGQVRLTFYLPTGHPTASGIWPYPGSAACSYNWPLGTVLALGDGSQVVCLDRGSGLGSVGWVDKYVTSHAEGRALVARLGDYTDANVVRWGW